MFFLSEILNTDCSYSSSTTEPSSLYLDVYFNAQPVATDGKQKPKATNALVPTCIAYQGSEVDFSVDMGSEVCTLCSLAC